MKPHWMIIAPTLLLAACSSSAASDYDSSEAPSVTSSYDGEESAEAAEFDEDRAREDAQQEAADDGYSGPCTQDCSGHDAGYAWAADGEEDGGISSSQSFDEGQEAYAAAVEEKLEEKRREFERDGADSEYAK